MKLEQAARQALEALELHLNGCGVAIATRIAYDALREALAEQAEQDPVAWVDKERMQSIAWLKAAPEHGTKLYAAPVRTKDLTDDEIAAVLKSVDNTTARLPQGFKLFARAVIAADRKKNK